MFNYKFKIKIIKLLNYILSLLNLNLDTTVKKKFFHQVINTLKVYDLGHPLIRLGSTNDGGYLVPDILNEIDYCFSPGVGSNIEFETDLLKHNIIACLAWKSSHMHSYNRISTLIVLPFALVLYD